MTLRRTPLHDAHARLGARMVEFAGFEMPVLYEGVTAEHRAVREGAGLFDVSHMGELLVEGPGAVALLQHLTPNDVAKLKPGRAQYSSLLTERGTFVDDVLVYRLAPERLMVVLNAANREKDVCWVRDRLHALRGNLPADVRLCDASDEMALLALQGPRAAEVLGALHEAAAGEKAADELRAFACSEGGSVAGHTVRLISRTGYTGEDGFEIYVGPHEAGAVWEAILAGGGVVPAGLGARDTLRLEAGLCLYGHEIDEDTTPIEAGLEWTVKPAKGDFLGREVLVRQMEEGTRRRLVGLEVTGRGIARETHAVHAPGAAGDEPVGRVTSGTQSPTLGRAIAMAHVATAWSEPGTELEVDVRGRRVAARVVGLPFHARRAA